MAHFYDQHLWMVNRSPHKKNTLFHCAGAGYVLSSRAFQEMIAFLKAKEDELLTLKVIVLTILRHFFRPLHIFLSLHSGTIFFGMIFEENIIQ